MLMKEYGKSGIMVSALGYGAGHIGGDNLSDGEVEKILDEITDLGINLIDTAKGYDRSEERIGRFLARKRDKIILSTKIGYGIPGYQDWTYECIIEGVNTALKSLKTDYIDIVHLHSCERHILERGDVFYALQRCVDEGKIRIAAYSGENDALSFAVNHPCINGIQCSVNICDQKSLYNQIVAAGGRGAGVIAKRPIANTPWKYNERPIGAYAEEYWVRFREMGLDKYEIDWNEAALRFTVFQENVSSAIVGSTKMDHIKSNIFAVEKGQLDLELERKIKESFALKGTNWFGQV